MHGIGALADVRSSPYSRFNPQYNRESLQQALRAEGIYYVFLGRELGARRDESQCYVGGKVSYPLVAQMPLFRQGLERLIAGSAKMRVAIMCAEKDPIECHRNVLVAHHARTHFAEILHIREDGRLESQESVDRRIFGLYRVDPTDMFRPHGEMLDDVYRRRGEEIAFEEAPHTAAS